MLRDSLYLYHGIKTDAFQVIKTDQDIRSITLMVPFDFSNASRQAVDYSLKIHSKFKQPIKLILFHAYQEPATTSTTIISIRDILKRNALDGLQQEKERIKKHHSNFEITVETILKYGELESTLIGELKKRVVDLLVLGVSLSSGWASPFMAGRSGRLSTMVNCPVLSVPAGGYVEIPKEVVFAADFEKLNNVAILEPIRKLLLVLGAHLHILHVQMENEPYAFNKQLEKLSLDDFFEGIPHTYHFIRNGNIENDIREFIVDNNTGLLLTINRKRDALLQLINRSLTRQLVTKLNTPVMVLHEAHA